ncbi:SurA N-terminal domain-containing protein [Acrocarpospora catenulata]|uniref:SurA N-terminal domain-containing protein n=1 Tax=Acrocarpospora catenulata TaxID=2836182 RepID=UPI001BD92E03|nr:SurA N-terminal domain-containing protein [Acrocarpospora catenulata]
MKRVLLAAAALACAAVTACSPVQVGAAATIGDQRISTQQLDNYVQEFQSALEAAKMPVDQTRLPGTVPQAVLLQLVNVRQFIKVAQNNGVFVSEGEIDAFMAQQGGDAAVNSALLGRGVPPTMVREWLRASIGAQKMIAQLGGGTDEAAATAGQQKLAVEADKVKVEINPRYGDFDPSVGWVQDTKFGKIGSTASTAASDEVAAAPAG